MIVSIFFNAVDRRCPQSKQWWREFVETWLYILQFFKIALIFWEDKQTRAQLLVLANLNTCLPLKYPWEDAEGFYWKYSTMQSYKLCAHLIPFNISRSSKLLTFLCNGRRRSNSIPWCTSFHVILSLRAWHIMISNLQHARNEHRSTRCGWFQRCFGSAASAFEIIELAYIRYAFKENFRITLTKKGFTCGSLICRELVLVRSVATDKLR